MLFLHYRIKNRPIQGKDCLTAELFIIDDSFCHTFNAHASLLIKEPREAIRATIACV
jgi:hypothetical protein